MRMEIDVQFSFGRKPTKVELERLERDIRKRIESIPDLVFNNINVKFY